MCEPWQTDETSMLEANLRSCAYNAAVNSDTPRGDRKMADLINAINLEERAVGKAKLEYLVKRGVIKTFKACPPACEVRPGGLFHAMGCENEMNHPVRKQRCQDAEDERAGKEHGWWLGAVSLVG